MKQIFEVSDVRYDADAKKASFTGTNYFLHDDGTKEVKTQGEYDFESESAPTEEEVVTYAQSLIEEGWEISVVDTGEDTTALDGTNPEAPAEEAKPEGEAAAE